MVAEVSLSPMEQEKILDESLAVVKSEAFNMKRHLDKGSLMEGLKSASVMLSELRTSQLSPKFYYRLYIDVTDELKHFELYLLDEFQKGRKVSDLYELVQYAAHIIPRMYLMITVGIVYIKSGEASRRDIIADLVEMSRGVQHPLRGLFLRNYLLQCTRGLLPDARAEPDNAGYNDGTIKDSIDFILLNFAEMNKLWVRMQYQGPSRDRDKREKERLELRILVGTNLVRLSQLDNVDIEVYRETILPAILEQVVSCRDAISQEYLMDCVIQVFPDEWHLGTLNTFLSACAELHQGVQMRTIVGGLIERLAAYAGTEAGAEAVASVDLFGTFSERVSSIVESRHDMPAEHVVALQTSLVNLALRCYPTRTDYADKVFESMANVFNRMNLKNIPYNGVVGREVMKLLRIPLEHYNNILTLLKLDHYASVIQAFDYRGRTIACNNVITNALDNDTYLPSVEVVEKLFALLSPLLVDQDDQPSDIDGCEDFVEEQNSVARLVSLMHSDDVEEQYRIILAARQAFAEGGRHRMRYTLMPCVFAAYKLLLRLNEKHKNEPDNVEMHCTAMTKLCKFALKTVQALQREGDVAEQPLRLLLQGTLTINQLSAELAQRETIAYEFMSQALSIFEEDISDSRAQLAALWQLVGTLQHTSCFTEENHEPLRVQCAKAAQKLFKKPDKCSGMCAVAKMLWHAHVAGSSEELHDGAGVTSALNRALKTAAQCMDPCVQVQLFTDVLDHYIYFAERGCTEITTATINRLMGKIRETLPQLEDTSDSTDVKQHFNNTIAYLRSRQESPSADDKVAFHELIL